MQTCKSLTPGKSITIYMKISFCFFCPHCQWANLKVLNLKFFFFNVRNVDETKKLKGDMGEKKKNKGQKLPCIQYASKSTDKFIFKKKEKKCR